jgi:hypothetical protein
VIKLRVLLLVLVTVVTTGDGRVQKQQRYTSFDPGHREFVSLGVTRVVTRVSCPNGFSPVRADTRPDCVVLRHDRFKLALFAATTSSNDSLDGLKAIARYVCEVGVDEELTAFDWSDLGDYSRESQYETSGGRIRAKVGKKQLGIVYRELTFDRQRYLVGYVFDLHADADDPNRVPDNWGGDSILGSIAETHVVCSITGERYDDLHPNNGGIDR